MTKSLLSEMPTFVILFWLILFFLEKEKKISKLFFIFFLFVALVNYMIYWCYFNINYELYYILDSLWILTSLSIFPLYYYYIRLLTKDIKIDYRWSWILIPSLLAALFSAIIYLMMSPQEIDILNNEIFYHVRPESGNYTTLLKLQLYNIKIMELIFVIEVVLTVFFGLRHIKEFTRSAKEFYSNEKEKELLNMQTTLLFLLAISFISIIFNFVIDKHILNGNHYILDLPSIAHSIALFGMGYAAYRQTFSIRQLVEDQHQTDDERDQEARKESEQEEHVCLDTKNEELFNRMEYFLNDEQIFKDADLRLNDLVAKLGSNRTYISQLISSKGNTNFSDYINGHRVKYAKKLLTSQEGAQMSLAEIALDAGFSNKSSFYRLFTKTEGTPPARYRKQMQYIVDNNNEL